jgi:hypothetical protein
VRDRAVSHAGALLSMEHGGPRIVVPDLWGWKSGKWILRLELQDDYTPGFWESITCHARGRVRDEHGVSVDERWAAGYVALSNVLTQCANVWHRLFGPRVYAFVMFAGGKMVGRCCSLLLAKRQKVP